MHRLFVAIRPPRPVRERLIDLMEGVPNLRWQDDEQLHITLRFIGEVERPIAEDVAAALGHLRFECFGLALDGIGKFERPRHGTLWAGVQPKDQLKLLAAKVERVCQSVGLDPERRAYHPHITLARWKGRASCAERFLELNAGLSSDPWIVDQFILFESRLGREGAHYEAIEHYALN